MIICYTLFYVLIINISLYVEQILNRSSQLTGILLSFSAIASFLSGIIYPQFLKIFKQYLIIATAIIYIFSFAIFILKLPLILIFIAVFLIGISNGIAAAHIAYIISTLTTQQNMVKGLALVPISISLGQFFSPFILTAIAFLIPISTILSKFYAGIILAIILIGLILFEIKYYR